MHRFRFGANVRFRRKVPPAPATSMARPRAGEIAMPNHRFLYTSIVAGTLCAVALAAHAAVPEPRALVPSATAPVVAMGEEEAPLGWLVELTEPATAQVFAATLAARGPTSRALAGAASRAQAQRNREQQQAVLDALRSARLPADAIMYQVVRAVNGIAFRAGSVDPSLLRALPGVKAVHAILPEYMHNASGVPFIGAPPVWGNTLGLPAAYKGEGIRIGIIDTGIDHLHPMFGGTGLLTDYQSARTATGNFTTTAGFPTAKVAGGFDFVGDAYNGGNTPAPDANPMDCNGHGSHVAGTAAGFGVTGAGAPYAGPWDTTTNFAALRIGPGAAPMAQLYALRVFGCGGSTGVVVQAIDWAMDPNNDDDLSDHLEVINMSLGSNYGRTSSSTAVASDNAAAAGVIVVISAGNSGDSFTVVGSPGSATRAITVANITSPKTGPTVNVTAPPGIAGTKPTLVAAWNTTPTLPVSGNIVYATPAIGCSGLTNAGAISGNIALIDRGTCNFDVKHNNAVNAGAIATIVVNNVAGPPTSMPGTPSNPAIPAVMISQTAGNQIKTALLSGSVSATLQVGSSINGDGLNASSSRGPTGGAGLPWQLKPDVAAPGTSIVSVQTGVTCGTGGGCLVPSATTYLASGQALTLSGTSMAAPHVAGAMALLRQAFPAQTGEALKARLMNGASPDIFIEDAGVGIRHGAARVGAGRVRVDNSATAPVRVIAESSPDASALVFEGEVWQTGARTRLLRLVNSTASGQTYDIAIDTISDMAGIAFASSQPSVFVGANSEALVAITMTFDAAAVKRGRDPTTVLLDVTGDSRPWLTEEMAVVRLLQGGVTKLVMPAYVNARPVGDLRNANGGTVVAPVPPPPNGSGTIPLTGTGVCTGTLAGTTCTTSPASPTAGNPRVDFTSLTFPFELHAINPRNASIQPEANVRFAGVSFDGTVYRFGIATWGNRVSPREVLFEVLVDNNNDGISDVRVLNGFPAVAGSQPSDTAVTAFGPAAGSSLALATYLNGYPAFEFDTAFYGSDVMVHRVTPANIGVTGTFRYRVRSCDLAGSCETLGPFVFSPTAQGVTFPGNAVLFSQPGVSIPVTWNAANIAANGSQGILLLHFHNMSGRRAEHVRLHSETTLATSAPTVAAGSGVTLTATVTGVRALGTVEFREGDRLLTGCGAVPVVGGLAQCATGALQFGTYTFIANYSGGGASAPSSGSVVQTVTPAVSGACAGLADVAASSAFCDEVDWLVNRQVTLGCGGGNYCPDADVARLSMAAFMRRLGGALTPVATALEQSIGPVDLDVVRRACAVDVAVSGFARTIAIDAILTATASNPATLRARLVQSLDGGTTWQALTTERAVLTLPSQRWTGVRLLGERAASPGENVRFALEFERDGLGNIDLADARCHLRALTGNRNPTHAPFDAAH